MNKDILIGGNHLANVLIGRLGGNFSTRFPPTMAHNDALEGIRDVEIYDVWCCWAAIMRARDADCLTKRGKS
jgi:hypothetical protein